MKLWKLSIFVAAVAALFAQSCAADSAVDLTEREYGYVQFKLYKECSYTPATKSSRADDEAQLDYLSEACKIEVNLTDENNRAIRQSLVLSAADSEAAEFGLRSDKLKLLAGEYRLGMITLFDALDNVLYRSAPNSKREFTVVAGGLTQHDVTVNVVPRGKVQFTLVKDLSSFEGTRTTRGEKVREYTFDEIKYIDIAVKRVRNNAPIGNAIVFENLPAKFSQHFDEDNDQSDKHGWKTSSIVCDTLLSLEADTYRVVSYTTKSKNSATAVLEVNDSPALTEFSVEDNIVTKTKVKISLYEADAYIKDCYALYEIWKSLDGENWCYDGENYQRGTNWNFNKDVDLWCEQPGVQVHSNGRIARIDLSGFGFRGEMSPAIGQLTELIELYLGTHNDTNIMYDPSLDLSRSLAERERNLFDDQRAYLRSIHPAIQMSEPCARALMEKGLTSPAIALYEQGGKESDIIDRKSGAQTIRKYDMNHGVLKNGLTKLPAEIGKLTKLEILNIANSTITELPAEIAQLVSLSSLEIYNCPKMMEFPMVIAELPMLRSVNISNNKQWSGEEMDKGFTALARGKSRKSIEILYARENNLTKLTKEMFGAGATENEGGLEAIGLLDLAFNKISTVEPLGKDVAFTQLYLDNNQIDYLPHDAEGYFCGYDDVETFSVNYNRLTMIPNIFNAKSKFNMTSVSFAGNQIGNNAEGIICEGEKDGSYKGINVKTLTLSLNPLKRYPKALADSNSIFEYLVVSACQIEEIEEGCFSHEKAVNHFSFDFSYNRLKRLPKDFHAGNMPYLYGVDLSFNRFEAFPFSPLDAEGLTVLAVRSQRNEKGERCLREWPQGIYQHKGLRGLYLGSNDLRTVDDTISTLCYYLDISDNPNIVFDASDICYAWQVGAYILMYDKTQKILNCDAMLE
ncbi:MAG: DUF4458 domain-containing protein [Rikenellaceae bacterium]|nr:DUF4458 domain-containing protein [Rikenellaceae bacterium]